MSHIHSISMAHYSVGETDPRIEKIENATEGTQKLYKMIQACNNGATPKVVLPFFVSTTDDITVFFFKGSMDGKDSRFFIDKLMLLERIPHILRNHQIQIVYTA